MQTSAARRSATIALAFVGLVVGAGFATGAEVIQYFVGFGSVGILGAALAGLLVSATGAVMLQLGSAFLAADHKAVFRSVAHPVIARVLDVTVTLTLFAIGFIMLAGAGATLHQQVGWPSWAGAALMTALVLVTGMLDVEKVSRVISLLTPLVIVAVVGAFAHTLLTHTGGFTANEALTAQTATPIGSWWLSALNYTGLVIVMAVSMCLVIGGAITNPREAFAGGLSGGLLYTVLMVMASVLLYLRFDTLGGASVPMLELFRAIHPALAWAMVVVIVAMIYNTAIGMFYALGRRLTADAPRRHRPVFVGVTLLGFAVSFVGFSSLMSVVYPLLGWMGLALGAILLVWWGAHRRRLAAESARRTRIAALLRLRRHPDKEFTPAHAAALEDAAAESVADDADVTDAAETEVTVLLEDELDGPVPPAIGLEEAPGRRGHDGGSAPSGSHRA